MRPNKISNQLDTELCMVSCVFYLFVVLKVLFFRSHQQCMQEATTTRSHSFLFFPSEASSFFLQPRVTASAKEPSVHNNYSLTRLCSTVSVHVSRIKYCVLGRLVQWTWSCFSRFLCANFSNNVLSQKASVFSWRERWKRKKNDRALRDRDRWESYT